MRINRPDDGCLQVAALVLAVLMVAPPGHAQEIEPRRWSHLPIGANFGGLGYAYTTGDISLEPELRIPERQIRSPNPRCEIHPELRIVRKSARVDIAQPYQFGHWTGTVNGVPAKVDREGLANTSARFAVEPRGRAATRGKEFAEYRASAEHETIVGLGLVLQFPPANTTMTN